MFMTFIRKAWKRRWTAPNTRTGKPAAAGFSLIELMIVLSIVGILASIAVPSYQRHLIKAREAVLAEDLYRMRQAIDKFFSDNLRYPDNLEELVSAKYLRALPKDPFTRSNQTWKMISPESASGEEPPRGSVFDVASGSDLIGLNGVPYVDW
jgi:general secretion pathway protein G